MKNCPVLLRIPFIFICLVCPGVLSVDTSNAQIPKKPEPVVMNTRLKSSENDSLIIIELTLEMDKNIHIFSPPSQFFEIKTVSSSGIGKAKVTLPKPKPYKNPDGSKADVFSGKTAIIITHQRKSDAWKVRGYIQFQACDRTKCFFPEKRWYEFNSDTTRTADQPLSK